ncbi:lectin c-type domain-containing protein [Ditylenchus destructor]|nr:lectin c-type domain-containing protein [Ditylenchus destructor]
MPTSPSTYKVLNNYLLSSKQYGRAGYPQTLVLITAAQNDSILNAVEIANVVRQSGSQLLVIGIGQNDTSESNFLYQLSDKVKLSSQLDFDSSKTTFAKWVLDAVNTTKVVSPPSKPFWRPDAAKSLTDAIGSPCSTNFFQSDMSVDILIDTTIADDELGDLGIYLADILSGLHLDGNTTSSSCVGLIKYDTASATYVQSLDTCATYDDLFEQLSDLASLATTDDNSRPDLFKALNMSLTDYKISPPTKYRLLLVTNQAYKSSDEKSIQDLAEQLKQLKVFIVTVDYSSNSEDADNSSIQLFRTHKTKSKTKASLSTTKLLQSICSGEQSFSKNDTDLETLITNTFAYTNCQCPKNLTQLTLLDPQTKHKSLFGDCLLAITDSSTAYSAEKQCEALGGSLLSLTSKEKFDFVHNRIVKNQLAGIDAYWTGLTLRSMDSTLNWYYYDRLILPVGNNNLVPDASNANATSYCGQVSVNAQSKGGPKIEFASCNTQLPFVCQIHAFDADHRLS